jgi:hypothetical protein
MRGLLLLGPLMLLAGFSPPDRLQGVQEGPPRSWIPEKAQKPPIAVTPELPKSPALPPGDSAAGGSGAPLSPVELQACATRERTSVKPTEDFVVAYNAAKAAIVAGRYDEALALSLDAEAFANAHNQKSAVLAVQMLIATGIGDAKMLEEAIVRRVEIGCVTARDLKTFDDARERIRNGK